MGANWWLWPSLGGIILAVGAAWRFGLPWIQSLRLGLDAYETDDLVDHLFERIEDEKNQTARKARVRSALERISADEQSPPKQ